MGKKTRIRTFREEKGSGWHLRPESARLNVVSESSTQLVKLFTDPEPVCVGRTSYAEH
jgi:hypothetical protein